MLNLDGKELFGIVLKENNFMQKESYKDYFEELWYDDENLILKFKEKFSYDFFENDKPIDYHFYLNFMGNEEVGYLVALSCISTNKLVETAKDYNVPIRELNDYDILTNHWIPILCQQDIDFEIIEDFTWYTNGIIDILETAIAVIPYINRMIGFYMDKTINGIGTTNWDLLKELLFDEDAIKNTLDRIKKGEN